jgi:hypothetical protein
VSRRLSRAAGALETADVRMILARGHGDRVVRGEIVAQSPDADQERQVVVSLQIERVERTGCAAWDDDLLSRFRECLVN